MLNFRMTSRRAGTSLLAVLITLVMLGIGTSSAAAAPVPKIDSEAETSLVIHKFEQPQDFGPPAPGVRQDVAGAEPIGDVSFTVTRVPGVDLTTNYGWEQVDQLTAAEARQLMINEPEDAKGTTDSNGELQFDGLDAALYLVQETSAPAGTVASAPFLVALPHPHQGEWLYTVHAYPKNAVVSTELRVNDADTVSAGEPVSWVSHSDIPRLEALRKYRIEHQLDPGLDPLGAAADVTVTLECAGCSLELTASDYDISLDSQDDGDTITVDFTADGRAKLTNARAADPDAQVRVHFDTIAAGSGEASNGEFTNRVTLVTEDADTGNVNSPVTDTATTKFGPLAIRVHELDVPEQRISDARFRLYLSAEDAHADHQPLTIDGSDEWTTDDDGMILIHGLRYSDFVNGLDREPSDALHRTYYASLTHIPPGWEADPQVRAGEVTSVSDPAVLIEQLWRIGHEGPSVPTPSDEPTVHDPTATGGPTETPSAPPEATSDADIDEEVEAELPVTGAQIAGLVILSILLIVGGLIFRARRGTASGEDAGTS